MAKTTRTKAAQAVLRGRGWKPGQKIKGEDAKLLRYHIERVSKSPVFEHLQAGTRPQIPTAEEQERIRRIAYLKGEARSRLPRGSGKRRIEDPEIRQSLIKHAHWVAGGKPYKETGGRPRYTFTPRSVQEKLDTDALLRERPVLVRMPKDDKWMVADHLAGRREDGPPWVIGVGSGFDAIICVVHADHEGTASEIAEDRWPNLFFNDLTRSDPSEEEQDEGGWDYIPSLGKWGKREEDIRIFAKAAEISRAKKLGMHDRLYQLTDGRVVEAWG